MNRPPAAQRWAEALGQWAIPDEIMAAATEDPWRLPPALFAADRRPAGGVEDRPSHRRAAAALGDGGSVLDVGCGGGGASVALIPPARQVTGVDTSAEMLEAFSAAVAAAGADHRAVQGRWPDVAATVAPADVVVCHHVAYNVADIAPFVAALDDHSRRLVVMEVTAHHPQSALSPLWRRFWGLERPDQPSADLLVEVVATLGVAPSVDRFTGPSRRVDAPRDEWVDFVRRQLCLPADRRADVEAALEDLGPEERDYVAVAWRPRRH
ncbi:MAG TPA: class I SAM-dependent methyltransferase [Acidimicrobiales bacterium]|nr:class I SAM-dependent methyltransferase [Acidimicrobiales bacterium]